MYTISPLCFAIRALMSYNASTMSAEHRENISPFPSHERPLTPENWVPTVDIITLSGHPGTGKTVVGKELAERYGMEYIKIGEIFRDLMREQQGVEVVDFVTRPEIIDEWLDEYQRILMRDAIVDKRKIVLEGRLSGLIAREEMDKANNEGAPISSIQNLLFTADPNERARRITNRYPGMTAEEALIKTRSREHLDLKNWRQFHPILDHVTDLYDPTETYEGRPLFADYIVDTTTLSVEDVIETVHHLLIRGGDIVLTEPRVLYPLAETGGILFPVFEDLAA